MQQSTGIPASDNRQRSVENCETNHFCACNVRTVTRAFRSKEQRPNSVNRTRFLPLACQHLSPSVRLRMRMLRNSVTSLELAKHDESGCALVFMQNHQLHTFVRTRLPRVIV